VIVDSHCHAWRRWPYEPPVPDPESRGRVEQLLWEMDRCGVDRAVLVCARIDHNPENNDYGHACVRVHGARLDQFADVDCFWWPTYQAPGAAHRLESAIARYSLKGFTHYIRAEDDGAWYLGPEARSFFSVARAHRQIVSLALPAHLQPMLRRLASDFPELTFLCHHMGSARVGQPDTIAAVLGSAAIPNIWLKISGFHYASERAWGFPYPDCLALLRSIVDAYGPDRLCWGSDYPVVRRSMTYRQSLEAFREGARHLSEEDRSKILGGTLAGLLARSG